MYIINQHSTFFATHFLKAYPTEKGRERETETDTDREKTSLKLSWCSKAWAWATKINNIFLNVVHIWFVDIHKNCLASLLKMNILWLWPKPIDTKSMDRNSNSLFSTSFSAHFMHTNVWKKYYVGKEKKDYPKNTINIGCYTIILVIH